MKSTTLTIPTKLLNCVDTLPWPSWVDTLDGYCLYANQAAKSAWGQELTGTNLTDLALEPEVANFMEAEDALVRAGEMVTSVGTFGIIDGSVYRKTLQLLHGKYIFGYCMPVRDRLG